MTQATAISEPVYKPMPTWLAVSIIAVCLVGSVGLLSWWFSSDRKPILVDLPNAVNEPRVRRPQMVDDNWNDDARSLGAGNWAVRSGQARLFVSRRDNKNSFRMVYAKDLVAGDDRALLRVTSSARRDDGIKQLALTPEQTTVLVKLPRLGASAMKTSKEDIARIESLWKNFEDAPTDAKEAPRKDLLTGVSELGEKNLEPSKAALDSVITTVRSTLTPEQIEKAKAMVQ